MNFSPAFLMPRSFGDKKISRKILSQYTKPFADNTQRNGTLAFAISLLNDQDWFEGLWDKRNCINQKPTLLIWGMKDTFLKPGYLEKFVSGFPDAKVHMLPTSGHFPQEEEPEIIVPLIAKFIEENQDPVKPSIHSPRSGVQN